LTAAVCFDLLHRPVPAKRGIVKGAQYRLYLRSAERIVCRYEFAAPDETAARVHAALLADAASDICHSFDLWQEARLVCEERVAECEAGGAGGEVPKSLVQAAEDILRSGWPVARSRRLDSRLRAWRKHPDMSLLERVIRDAVAATGADTGNIQIREPGGDLRIVAQQGLERDFLDFFAVVVKAHDTSCGQAAEIATPVIVEDVARSPIFRGKASGRMLLSAGLQSTCSIPIIADGALRGVMSTHRRANWHPGADELSTLERFATEAAAAMGG
jgi:GAF domain